MPVKEVTLENAISHMAGHIEKGNLCLMREPHGGNDAGTRLSRLTITNTMAKGILFLEVPYDMNRDGEMTPAIQAWEKGPGGTGDSCLSSVAKTAEGKGWKTVGIDSKVGGSKEFHTDGGTGGKDRQEMMAVYIYQYFKKSQLGAICPIGTQHMKGTNYNGGYESLARILTQKAPMNRDTYIIGEKIRYQIVK
ncbi:MAG: hypothetical protein AAFR47_11155, partial [Pseudomonadota bacterium]